MRTSNHDRRGISLMEVLISIGILSVGLVSVLSLIPAGRYQTSKATAIDRTTMLAMNTAADFINRGFTRPAGWTAPPTAAFAVFDPLDTTSFWTTTFSSTSVSLLTPRIDAATTGTGASLLLTSATTKVTAHLSRGDDDVRYSTDGLGPDDLPVPMWSISGTSGRHVFDGAYSYLATLSGGSTTTWNPEEYKTLTIVTFARRDTASVVRLFPTSSPTADGSWTVDKTTVPEGTTLKELAKPGTLILFKPASGGSPAWYRVLLASDMTPTASPSAWKLGLTCEPGDPATASGANLYVFPGAVGSTQLLVKLEGTSQWNDR